MLSFIHSPSCSGPNDARYPGIGTAKRITISTCYGKRVTETRKGGNDGPRGRHRRGPPPRERGSEHPGVVVGVEARRRWAPAAAHRRLAQGEKPLPRNGRG